MDWHKLRETRPDRHETRSRNRFVFTLQIERIRCGRHLEEGGQLQIVTESIHLLRDCPELKAGVPVIHVADARVISLIVNDEDAFPRKRRIRFEKRFGHASEIVGLLLDHEDSVFGSAQTA